MKWEFSSAERFIEHQEYIDTAIIPVVKVELGQQFKASLSLATWLTGIAHALEEQLTGRVMLFPAYTYVETRDRETLNSDLATASQYYQEHQFKHSVYLSIENELVESSENLYHLLPVPLPEEDEEGNLKLSKELMGKVAQNLVNQLINLWQK